LVPAVYQVDENTGSVGREVGGKRLGDESVKLTICGVDQKIQTPADGEA
jgi:hypothetical protein